MRGTVLYRASSYLWFLVNKMIANVNQSTSVEGENDLPGDTQIIYTILYNWLGGRQYNSSCRRALSLSGQLCKFIMARSLKLIVTHRNCHFQS